MDAPFYKRRENLSTIVLLIVVYGALQISRIIPDFEKKPMMQIIALLTSKGAYELMVRILFWLVNSNDITLRMYWGELYIKGVWSYEYERDGKRYFGVWDIRQDVDKVTLIGNGLDEDYRLRTIVRSVSPLIEEAGGYFFINRRDELQNQGAQVFSKTTLLLDRPRKFLGGVSSMRGITQVYGGPSDKHLHQNVVFHRHSDVSNIEELIEKLRQSDFHLSSAKINANSHTNKLICLLFSFAPQKLKDRYARYESTEKKAGAKSDDISQP